jgi:VanZ family protein
MNSSTEPRAKYWFWFSLTASAGLLLVITVASVTPAETFREIYDFVAELLSLDKSPITLKDKPGLGHFICYTLLSFFLAGVLPGKRLLIAPLAALGYGILMEFVQVFIPSRDASLMDIAVNALGVTLGLGMYWLVQRLKTHAL